MAGDGLVRPLNAPAGQPPAYGTQPGVNQAVITANRVIVFGAGSGIFVYNGKPAAGNLISSVTDSTVDPFGLNATLTGITGYSHVGGTFYAVQNGGSGTVAATIYYTATSAAGPYTIQASVTADAAGFQLASQGPLILSTADSAGSVTATLSSGLSGGLPVTQLDRTALSVGNSVTAAAITNTWTIDAHDGDNGAKYTIEAFVTVVTGATAAETLLLGLLLDGVTFVGLATLGAAFNGSATSTTYGIPVRLILVPGAGSGGDAEVVLSGPLGDLTANRLATNSANMAGISDTVVFDTTVTHSVALYAQWGGTGGAGQFAGTNWSEFTRSGQN